MHDDMPSVFGRLTDAEVETLKGIRARLGYSFIPISDTLFDAVEGINEDRYQLTFFRDPTYDPLVEMTAKVMVRP